MLGALLAGEGLAGVAELAAAEAGRPVAILLPARGMSACSDVGLDLGELKAYAAGLGRGEGAAEPGTVDALEPVLAGGEPIGIVVALRAERNGLPELAVDRAEVLRTAALAALTEVAVATARDEVAGEVRGTLLEDLREGSAVPPDIVRRAARLGCDLSRGAVALVAEIRSARPRHAAALITSEHPGAIAEPLADRDRGRRGPG